MSLSVTDNGGASNATSKPVVASAPSAISLSASGSKVRGSARTALTWSGATGTNVDVYRNGALLLATPNDGAHTDVLGKVTGTFTYKVCNTGSTTCSNNAV